MDRNDGPVSAPGADPVVADSVARRSLIDLALQRRPELTPEGLRQVLVALDMPVDESTLAADLAALGIEVLYRADGSPVLHRAGPPAPTPRDHWWDRSAEGSEDQFHNARLLAAGAAAVVLLVATIGIVLVRGGSRDSAAPTTASATPPPGGAAGNSTTVPLKVAPSGPGTDLNLLEGVTGSDDFDGDGDGLGEAEGVGAWTIGSGVWSTSGSVARLTAGSGGVPSVAWVDAGSPDVRAQIALPDLVQGAGIAFRVVDAGNFWLWTASPDYATATLVRVEDGVYKPIDNSGYTRQAPGLVLGVHAVGDKIEVLANGAVVLTVTDDTFQDATGLGMGALADVAGATFDKLLLKPGA